MTDNSQSDILILIESDVKDGATLKVVCSRQGNGARVMGPGVINNVQVLTSRETHLSRS